MGKRSGHRSGSLAFNPRKRASRQMARVNHWPARDDKAMLGFAGYKAGMTSISYIDDSTSPNAGNEVFGAVTVLEVPSMIAYGVRAMSIGQISAEEYADEKTLKSVGVRVKEKKTIDAGKVEDVFILAAARPEMTGFGKKQPEKMMIGVGGKTPAEKLEFARSLLGKEVKASDFFKVGEYVDAISVTSGKGWQGTVKRFGTATQRRKATNKVRHTGTLGAWHPGYVQYTVPRPGQMGYHHRTELNTRIMKIVTPAEINPKGGFPHYGLIKNECLLLFGSVGGPVKRLIRIRKAARNASVKTPEVRHLSLESKQ
ncbi:MAG: 50S ribosomal protein L3 [Candidatus Micrarchaeota archaeon]|nr:50S ribosomal protein L3 [Candidatus Micrarchaeota archaeon]